MDLFTAGIYASSFVGIFTTLVYLFTIFERKRSTVSPKPTKLMPVSVLVPAFNEQGRIERTVKSLLNLNYPKHLLEIILVDDGSTDNTLNEMKLFESNRVKIFHKSNGGKYSALNYGLKKSKGEIIVSLDADSFVDKNALIRMLGFFDNPDCMAVAPSMKVWKPRTILQKVQFVEYLMGVFLRKAASMLNCIHVTPGPFSAYRRSFFDKHGGYKEAHGTEDMEVALRIQSNNYIIEHAADAYSYTPGPSKFSALFNQRVRWYKGFINNMIDYKHLFSKKYGTFGLFYLPSAIISVFFTVFLVGYALKKLFGSVSEGLAKLWSINFDITKLLPFKMDWFYFTPSLLMTITIVAFVFGTIFVFMGKWLSNDKEPMVVRYFLTLILYAPLYALWWCAAAFCKATGKNIKWAGVTWKKD